MSTNLVQLSEHLKNLPDQWLAREMQTPTGAVPPYLVLGELQRRKLLRSGSGAQAPSGSVAQDTVADTLKQITPPAPQGAPPPPGMASPQRNPPMPGAKPPQNMADGGTVGDDDEEEEDAPPPNLIASAVPLNILDLLDRYSAKNKVPPAITHAVALNETKGYDPNAVSSKGAGGVMQLMPATAKRFGLTDQDRFDPEKNIDAGTQYLSWLYNRYHGDVPKTLAAYNAGEGAVDKYHGVPPYRETQNYVKKGMQNIGTQDLGLPAPTEPVASTIPDQTPPPTLGAGDIAPPNFQMPNEWLGGGPTAAGIGPGATQPTLPESVTSAKTDEDAARARLTKLMGEHTPYDVTADLPTQDYSKEEKEVREQIQYAKDHLNPSISQTLMQMGAALLASRSPFFGVALGEAGLTTLGSMEKHRQEMRSMYLDALKAGVNLQDKKNAFAERNAQLKVQVGLAGEKDWRERVTQAQKDVDEAHKDYTKAFGDYNKSLQFKTIEQAMMFRHLLPPDQQAEIVRLYNDKQNKSGAAKEVAPTTQTYNAKALDFARTHNITLDPKNTDFASQVNAQRPDLLPDFVKAVSEKPPGPAKAPAAATSILTAQALSFATKNGIKIDPSNPDYVGQIGAQRPDLVDAFLATTTAGQAEQDRTAKNLQTSRENRNKWVDNHSKITDGQLDKVNAALHNLQAGGGPADAIGLLETIPATAGGPGSGVRLTKNEIDTLLGGQSFWEQIKAKALHLKTGELFPDDMRNKLVAALQRIQEKAQTKQEILGNGRARLADSNDINEHWRIQNDTQNELVQLGQHEVALRDPKDRSMRYFDNTKNLPRPQYEGQVLKDPAIIDQFRDAAGKNPARMIKRLVEHWGWRLEE
jgi:hypothetical protein